MKSLFFLLPFVKYYNICIISGSSGLGKELIYQGINDYNKKILTVTKDKNNIKIPYRGNTFDEKPTNSLIKSKNLDVFEYDLDNNNNVVPFKINKNFDHLIFTSSGTAFEDNDYSDELTEIILENLPNTCKSITMISPFGIKEEMYENIFFYGMRKIYLKNVYDSKEKQEKLINALGIGVEKNIIKSSVLSYGDTKIKSKSRQNLAKEIFDTIL